MSLVHLTNIRIFETCGLPSHLTLLMKKNYLVQSKSIFCSHLPTIRFREYVERNSFELRMYVKEALSECDKVFCNLCIVCSECFITIHIAETCSHRVVNEQDIHMIHLQRRKAKLNWLDGWLDFFWPPSPRICTHCCNNNTTQWWDSSFTQSQPFFILGSAHMCTDTCWCAIWSFNIFKLLTFKMEVRRIAPEIHIGLTNFCRWQTPWWWNLGTEICKIQSVFCNLFYRIHIVDFVGFLT